MKLPLFSLALCTAACIAVPVREELPPPARRAVPACVLPAPQRALELAWDEDSSLDALLRALTEATGLAVVQSETSRGVAQAAPLGLGAGSPNPLRVPPHEVYSVAEALLASAGFVTAPLHQGETILLGVYARSDRDVVNAIPVPVTPDEALEIYADHRALLVTTTVELPGSDVRQLSTMLRAKTTDTRTQAILPLASNSLHLQGTGAWVAGILRIVLASDRASVEQASLERSAATRDRSR